MTVTIDCPTEYQGRYRKELQVALAAAIRAGEVVLQLYNERIGFELKEDRSEVTRADLESDRIIQQALRAFFPDDAILSEESADDASRLKKKRVWIVDPMDGTSEFVNRTGEFMVQLALAVDGAPVVGVVHHPPSGDTYWACEDANAWLRDRAGKHHKLKVSAIADPGRARGVFSRFHMDERSRGVIDALPIASRARMGSSTKWMAVAAGKAEVVFYLPGRTKEWDTCAPQLILERAGGCATTLDGEPIRYNKPEGVRTLWGALITNGAVHDALLQWVRERKRTDPEPFESPEG